MADLAKVLRLAIAGLGGLLLAGCVGPAIPAAPQPLPRPVPSPSLPAPVPRTDPLPPAPPGFRQPEIMQERGLQAIIRTDAASLRRRLGRPRLDVAEGDMRKLQFSGEACVLDIFLYPLRPGAEPVATWVEARRASDGQPVDRAACVAALARR